MKTLLLIIFSVALGVVGQFMLKRGIVGVTLSEPGVSAMRLFLATAFASPHVWLGFALYAISSISWLVVLSRAELSYAYPLVSLGYVMVVILSRFIFQEQVTPMRIVGTVVICVGVFLISRS